MKIRILKSMFLVGVLSWGVIFSMCVPSVVCASDYYIPLFEAAKQGDLGEVKRLVEAGADVNCDFKHGATLLRHAKDNRYGEEEICRLLKSHGAKDPNDSCVIM